MRALPAPDPGVPDSRSATRYLLWLVRCHAGPLAGATALLCGWFGCRALAPAALGEALDALVAADPRSSANTVRWIHAAAAKVSRTSQPEPAAAAAPACSRA